MNKFLFVYLSAFSHTGGIEKFNRSFCKALTEISLETKNTFKIVSVYDSADSVDERYLPLRYFKGYNKNRTLFSIEFLRLFLNSDHIIIGHINLAPVVVLAKLLFPRKKVTVITHGIEVWKPLPWLKKRLLRLSNKVLCVSNYTADKIQRLHGIKYEKLSIFPNTIDPYFSLPDTSKALVFREQYNLKEEKIILTVARLSHSEKYKGYDQVLRALPAVIKEHPQLKYVLVGKSDNQEYNHLKSLINTLNLQTHVILTGFVSDQALTDYYQAADVFIMPSKKEGFGIVFIEALSCGVPVIAGNQDGSVDALLNGELGTLINPDSVEEIAKALTDQLNNKKNNLDQLKIKVFEAYGFPQFKARLGNFLKN